MENVPTRIVDADNFRTYVKHQFHIQNQHMKAASVRSCQTLLCVIRKALPCHHTVMCRCDHPLLFVRDDGLRVIPEISSKRSHMIDGCQASVSEELMGWCIKIIREYVCTFYENEKWLARNLIQYIIQHKDRAQLLCFIWFKCSNKSFA